MINFHGCPVKILSWEFEIGYKRHFAVFLPKQKTANVNGDRAIDSRYEDLINFREIFQVEIV